MSKFSIYIHKDKKFQINNLKQTKMEIIGYCRKLKGKFPMQNPKVKTIREGKGFFASGTTTDEQGNEQVVVSLISKATFDAAVAAGVPVVQ